MNKKEQKSYLKSALEEFSKNYDEKALKSALSAVSGKKFSKRFVYLSDIRKAVNDLGCTMTLELI